jgi:hypothetical protein
MEIERFYGKTVGQVNREWEGYTIFSWEQKNPTTFDSRRLVLSIIKTSEHSDGWTVVGATVG